MLLRSGKRASDRISECGGPARTDGRTDGVFLQVRRALHTRTHARTQQYTYMYISFPPLSKPGSRSRNGISAICILQYRTFFASRMHSLRKVLFSPYVYPDSLPAGSSGAACNARSIQPLRRIRQFARSSVAAAAARVLLLMASFLLQTRLNLERHSSSAAPGLLKREMQHRLL